MANCLRLGMSVWRAKPAGQRASPVVGAVVVAAPTYVNRAKRGLLVAAAVRVVAADCRGRVAGLVALRSRWSASMLRSISKHVDWFPAQAAEAVVVAMAKLAAAAVSLARRAAVALVLAVKAVRAVVVALAAVV